MDPQEFLQEIGLSKGESIVYLALLALGQARSGKIIKETSLQSSVVHNCLNTLSQKGFISHVLENSFKTYHALDPKVIGSYLETRHQQFNEILPKLKSLKRPVDAPSSEVYEGFGGMWAAVHAMLDGWKKGDVYKYFAADVETNKNLKAKEFFAKIDILRKKRGIIVRGIAESSIKPFLGDYVYSDLRFTSQKIPYSMNIYKDRILLISFAKVPTGILIHSREIANQYDKMWDSLWKDCEKENKGAKR